MHMVILGFSNRPVVKFQEKCRSFHRKLAGIHTLIIAVLLQTDLPGLAMRPCSFSEIAIPNGKIVL